MKASNSGPTFSVPQKTLRGLINQVHFSMAVHDIRYYLNGILFIAEGRTLTLVATDGHRLALAQSQLAAEVPNKQEVILPRKTVLELQRLLKDEETADRDALRQQPGQVRLSAGMEFVTKLVEGKFPDYNRVIPRNHKNIVNAGPPAVPGEPAARGDSHQREVQERARQHRAWRTAHRFQQCRTGRRPRRRSRSTTNGDPIEIGFNVTYLIEVLANTAPEMVRLELQDSSASALFTVPEEPGFKYVVMPMRI